MGFSMYILNNNYAQTIAKVQSFCKVSLKNCLLRPALTKSIYTNNEIVSLVVTRHQLEKNSIVVGRHNFIVHALKADLCFRKDLIGVVK
jgi:hypothetical protein